VADGAEMMFRTALAAGVDVCFANPGTTEMAMVAALDRVPGIRPVLGLFEGVCSGACHGYARVADRPALGLYHLGPGYVNALANLHNARRSFTPVVNLVGDQASWHLPYDAPLSSDTTKLATWVGWHRHVNSASRLASDTAAAIHAATDGAGGPATLVIPADTTWDDAPPEIPEVGFGSRRTVPADRVMEAAAALRSGDSALIVGGPLVTAEMAADMARIAAATGCRPLRYRAATNELGLGRHFIPDIPYFPEAAARATAGVRTAVLLTEGEPVTFFGYPDIPSTTLPADCRRLQLAGVADDIARCLSDLADAVGAGPATPPPAPDPLPAATGPLDIMSLGRVLAAEMPENAVLVQDGITSAAGFLTMTDRAAPFRMIQAMGGAIGAGLPTALGAAIAAPDRRVMCLQSDGSAMYTIQALWSMAREGVDVTVIMANNHRYNILQMELHRAGIDQPGPNALALTELSNPDLDFCSLARGMGVPASRATTAEELTEAVARANATPGPTLVEAIL